MNPYFWKKTRILLKNKSKMLLLLSMPILYALFYMFGEFNLDYTAFWTAVSCSLIAPVFLEDIQDMLNYEYAQIVERKRRKFILGYFVYPMIILYLLSFIEAVIMMALFAKASYAFNISPLTYIMGLIFCIMIMAVGNGQLYNYRKWVQYSAAPMTILIFALPVLSLLKNTFVIEYLNHILIGGIILNGMLLLLYILLFDLEKSITDAVKLVAGYGKMND